MWNYYGLSSYSMIFRSWLMIHRSIHMLRWRSVRWTGFRRYLSIAFDAFWLTRYWIADAVTNEFRYIYWGSRHWNPTDFRADSGKQISIEDQLLERCVSRDRTSRARMLAIYHKVLRDQKLLCIIYPRNFIAFSSFRRALSPEECPLRDSYQNCQL